MKNKFFIGAIAILMGAIMLVGCSTDTNKAKQDGTEKKEKVLVVGTNATFVPFEFKNEETKDYDGYDIDMIKAIAKQMNAKIEFQNVSFDALIPALGSKHIDIAVSGMTITKARAEKVLFSAPYYESGLAFMVKEEKGDISSPAGLTGKTVSVQMGTTGAELASKLEGVQVKQFDHSNEAILEMKINGVDAVIVDLPVAQYYAATHKDEKIKVVPFELKEKEYFGMAMNKENLDLQKEVNNAIAELKKSGEFNKIYNKWFKQDAPADMPTK